MGATVTTGKAVHGFKSNSGQIIYVLSEQTYEKNVSPHIPHWGVLAIGTYDEVMKRVYLLAACADSGSLTNKANNLSAETYLRGWVRAFNKPMNFSNKQYAIKILDRDLWNGGIESINAGAVFDRLKKIDRLDLWNKLAKNEEVLINLHDDVDVIRAIYGTDGVEQTWKLINSVNFNNDIDKSLVPEKRNGDLLIENLPEMVKITTSYGDSFALLEGDRFINSRRKYEVLDDYISNQAYTAEMAKTGEGIKHIQLMKEQLNNMQDSANALDAFIDKSSITPDLIKQFEYNVNINYEDMNDVHKLPSAVFGIDKVYSSIKVYFKKIN